MNKNQVVLSYCPNFYRIINFEYYEDDFITEKLIKVYEDFIFRIDIDKEEDIAKVKSFDYVISRYLEDYQFRKEMQKELIQVRIKKSCKDILRAIVDSILTIFERYTEGTTRRVYISRWI